MTTISLEDLAAIRASGRSVNPECLCDEYSHLILLQSTEIKALKEKIDNLEDQLENIFHMG